MRSNKKYLPVEWCPGKIQSGWLDLFECRIDSSDGLPPSARAEIVLAVMKHLDAHRRSPCLNVVVDSPGEWYVKELRQSLIDCSRPIAVTRMMEDLKFGDFFQVPATFPVKPASPDFQMGMFNERILDPREKSKLSVLRSMARMSVASTTEIAAASRISPSYARKLLPELAQDGLIEFHEKSFFGGKPVHYPVWEIKRPGIQYAHQSWNIPVGMNFRGVRSEQKYAGERHRKTARLWPAWVEEAYGEDFEIWGAWSEPSVKPAYPDALVWGVYKGDETLIWLEVETGKKSRENIARDINARLRQAGNHAYDREVLIIFVVLAQPWVLETIRDHCYSLLPMRLSLISENWRNFGYLSVPVIGETNSMFKRRQFPFIKDIAKILKLCPSFLEPKFDPDMLNMLLSYNPLEEVDK